MAKALTEREKQVNRERAAIRTSERRRMARLAFVYKFDMERMKQLCTLIASGHSAPRACKLMGMSEKTLFHWTAESKEALTMYEVACQARADARAEEVVTIADDSKDPKLRISARKWDASRRKPEKYGDRGAGLAGGQVSLIQLIIGSREIEKKMLADGYVPPYMQEKD